MKKRDPGMQGTGILTSHSKSLSRYVDRGHIGKPEIARQGDRDSTRTSAAIKYSQIGDSILLHDHIHKFFGLGSGNEHRRRDNQIHAVETRLAENVLQRFTFVEPTENFCHLPENKRTDILIGINDDIGRIPPIQGMEYQSGHGTRLPFAILSGEPAHKISADFADSTRTADIKLFHNLIRRFLYLRIKTSEED